MNPVNSTIVANEFLTLADKAQDPLTPMQLLKLVYIAHGWMLGLFGRPLISDKVEAWRYGPVIPSLYNQIRSFRSKAVVGPLKKMDGELDDHARDVVRQVFEKYGKMSGPMLSRLTHAKGTPWEATWDSESFGNSISNDLIEDHYKRLYIGRSGERAVA